MSKKVEKNFNLTWINLERGRKNLTSAPYPFRIEKENNEVVAAEFVHISPSQTK